MNHKAQKEPWIIQTKANKVPHSSWRCWVGPLNSDVSCAEVHGFFSEEECVSNAHLIASSPDMYAVLEKLSQHPLFAQLEIASEIRGVLAKANGEFDE